MSLADCIAKAGKALNARDREAIESLVEDGVSEEQAVSQHLESLDQEIDQIAAQVEGQGGTVDRLAQDTAPRNELGLYSGVHQAVLDMPLPEFKADKPAHGMAIWLKLSKMPGVKKEELQWLGIEEFLLAGDKFTREQVLNFIEQNGVEVEETVADETGASVELTWDNGEVWDDEEAWSHHTEDLMYEFDNANLESDDLFFFEADEWLDANITQVFENYEPTLDKDSAAELERLNQENADTPQIINFIESKGFDVYGDMKSSMRDDAETAANDYAYESYMQDPVYIYSTAGDSAEIDLFIFGNDDQGYDIREGSWQQWENSVLRNSGSDISYSINEAEIQAQDYARDQGLLTDEDSETAARWEDYVEGQYENYREVKLKLPFDRTVKGGGAITDQAYYNETHFPDPNIVAFLRVTDRALTATPLQDNELSTVDGKTPSVENTYFVDEFQSDWHQQGRQEGYSTGEVDAGELSQQAEDTKRDIEALFTDEKSEFMKRRESFLEGNADQREMMLKIASDTFNRATLIYANYGEIPQDEQKTEMMQDAAAFLEGSEKIPQAVELGRKVKDLNDRAQAERYGVPDAPFKGDAWIGLGLKRALVQAAQDGYEQFAWADSNVLSNRWSERYRGLYEMQYDKKMPSIVKKLTKQKPVHLRQDGTPFPTSEEIKAVIDKARAELEADGQTILPNNQMLKVERNEAVGVDEVNLYNTYEGTVTGHVTGYLDIDDALQQSTSKLVGKDQGYWVIELDEDLRKQITEQGFPLFQERTKPRGYFDPERFRITLTPRANLSTFLHESGHAFLTIYRDLAPMDASIQRDLAILEGWWQSQGATDDTQRHEMFASGFETYLQEGKAPTQELQPLFARFSSWLTMIYKRLGEAFRRNDLPAVELSDEVRGVMDRLVASQGAIEAAASEQQYGPFKADQIGMSPAEARAYQQNWDEARAEQEADLTGQIMRELQRERERWWRQGVAEKSETVAAELAEQPEYRARDYLSGDRIPDGVEPRKLDRAYISDIYGKQAERRLRYMTSKDGVNPDRVASLFSYRNGDELVRALLGTMTKSDRAAYVKAQAEQQMRDEHGEMRTDGSMTERAQKAVHSDKQAELLLLELRRLNRSSGKRQTPRQFFKAAAERTIRAAPIDKVRPEIHRRNEVNSRSAALRAAAEDDFDTAALEQHKAVRQFYLYREALRAKEKANSHRNRLAQIKKTKYSARRVDPDYVQAVKVLVAAYDLRKQPKDSNARLEQVRNFIESQKETNPDLIADGILSEITSWKTMTLDELGAVLDAAENLLKIGKTNSERELEAFRQQVDSLTASIEENTDKPKPAHTTHSLVSRAKKSKSEFSAAHRKLESLLQELDGWQDNGPMSEAIFKPLWDAQLAEIQRLTDEHAELDELFEGYNYLFNAMKDSLQDVEATRKYVDLHEMPIGDFNRRSLSRGQRIVLALNWGNEGNREALRTQEGHQFTDEAVMEALETLTPDELQLVNRIWRYVDKFYPELAKTEQEATGVAPAKVEAEPFVVNGVEMRGGYFPLQADSALSWRAEMHAVEERAERMRQGGAARASTKHGSTIERVGFGGQIVDLSIDSLFKHVDGVVHDITHRKAVMDVDRLLRSPEVRESASRLIGREGYKAITQAVVRLAGGNTHPSDMAVLNRLMRFSRIAASYGAMGYSVRTGLLNLTGLLPAIPEVGQVRMVSAILEEIANPAKFGREVMGLSTFMENRGKTITRDVFEVMRNLKGHSGWNSFKSHAFYMIVKVDAFISRAVWKAAHTKALNAGQTEEQAVFDADRTVARTQGTGLKIDLSAVEDQNEIFRAMSPMYTYFNAILNLAKRRAGKRRTGQISNAKFMADMFWIFIAVAIAEEAMFGHGEDDETEEEAVERYARATAGYYLGQWFGIRELSGYVEYGQMFETPLQKVISAPPRAAGEGLELIFDQDAEFDKGSIRAGTDLLPVLGFPSGAQINRMGRYLIEYEEEGGEFSPYGFLVTGKHDDE